jgi:membrane fusion protein (multidrug efflux system)
MDFYRKLAPACWPSLFMAALALTGCGGQDDSAGKAPLLPVEVVTAERQDVALSIDLVGTTRGTQDVPIRARVEGFLDSMDFREGGFVKKGDLLYTIDPQPFKAKVVEARSKVAAAETMLVKADADLRRIRPLAEMKAVSEQDLDSAVAQEAASRAGVQAAEAVLDLANIELSYTRIIAPIDGLIGLSKAKPGEFVGRAPNPVVLNTLSDINPIRVRFSISEREYLILARNFAEEEGWDAERVRTEGSGMEMILLLADGTEHPHKGQVVAQAQSIDPETGTYSVEALFPNPRRVVLPGQFARVRAPYETLEDTVVVPYRAIVEIQGRFRVYVVGAGNEVEVREIILGPSKGNDVVIESGLEGGESVIVEGLQRVRPGMVVAPTEAAPDSPAQQLET